MILFRQGDGGIALIQSEDGLGNFGECVSHHWIANAKLYLTCMRSFANVIRVAYANSPARHCVDPQEVEQAIQAHRKRSARKLAKCDGVQCTL